MVDSFWLNTTREELIDALKEVEWTYPPRPISEFLLGKYIGVKDQRQLLARLKNNLWYYRTNYAIVIAALHLVAFVKRPLALIAVAISALALLVQNDSFASALNNNLTRSIRRIYPALAVKLRLYASMGSDQLVGAPNLVGKRRRILIAGLERSLFSLATGTVGFLLLLASGGVLWLAAVSVMGSAVVGGHAAVRQPNLKARFHSAREDFKVAWRQANSSNERDTTA